MTSQIEQQASNLHGHLPECPAPLCDAGAPNAECMGWEDCHHLCCCDALRACEGRLREGWCVSTCGNTHYTIGYEEALDAAREAVTRTCGHTKYEGCSPCLHDDAIAAIDALRDQPADQTGYNLPDAP